MMTLLTTNISNVLKRKNYQSWIRPLTKGMLIASFFALGACSHTNPLMKKQDNEALQQTAQFLVTAAKTAGHALTDMPGFSGNGADVYEDCMSGDMQEKNVCQTLYKNMVSYAATTHSPYRELDVDDITDKTMWKMMAKAYEDARFNDSPDLPMEF